MDDCEGVAGDILRIAVSLHCSGTDHSAAGLPSRLQGDESSVNCLPGLCLKFTYRYLKGILPLRKLTLGDRPGMMILISPEGSPGMNQKYLQRTRAPA